MPTIATDFSEYELGVAPHDWTGTGSAIMVEVPEAPGGQALHTNASEQIQPQWQSPLVTDPDAPVLGRFRPNGASTIGVTCRRVRWH